MFEFPWNIPRIFGNCPQNLPEIFTTFRNSYKFHSQNFYFLRKNFINSNYIYKIYPTISTDQNCRNIYTNERRKIRVNGADKNCIITFWCISKKWLAGSYRIPNSQIRLMRSATVWKKVWKSSRSGKITYVW